MSAIPTALSGLSAASTAIDVVGNNLANLNTTGYKDVGVSFEDMVSEYAFGGSNTQIGLGVHTPFTTNEFTQGAINPAAGPFDAAINGNGFFVVKDSSGQTLLTRAGDFQSDAFGNLVSATGQAVQGWQAAANGTINTGGPTTSLSMPVGQTYPPQATTTFSMDANLNSAAASGTTFTQQINAVDSLGNPVPLTVTFTQSATPGTWSYQVSLPASLVSGSTGTAAVDLLKTPGTITFDANGNLKTPAAAGSPIALTVPGLTDGATIGSAASNVVNWNLYNPDGTAMLTQFSQASASSANSQDGQPASQLTSVAIGTNGQIEATYSSGAQQLVGQLAMGTILNPQSLLSVGNNSFSLSGESSALTIGTSGTGGRGEIQGQALEGSTVDMAAEFANLLVFQRSYQANSRVITASDELVQDTLALIK